MTSDGRECESSQFGIIARHRADQSTSTNRAPHVQLTSSCAFSPATAHLYASLSLAFSQHLEVSPRRLRLVGRSSARADLPQMKPTPFSVSRARASPTLSPTPAPPTPLPTIFAPLEGPELEESAVKKRDAETLGDGEPTALAQQRVDLVSGLSYLRGCLGSGQGR